MKQKNRAFTLIELLVVIVIIGILATTSTATFNGYFAKARDAERITTMSQLEKILKIFYIEEGVSNSLLSPPAVFANVLVENGADKYEAKNDICIYLFGARHNSENGWLMATYGETTSTQDATSEGVLYLGTEELIQVFENSGDTFSVDSFSCDDGVGNSDYSNFLNPFTGIGGALMFGTPENLVIAGVAAAY